MSNHNGFTLLETMFVMICIAILICIFPISSKFNQIQQKQEIYMLYDFLLQAQQDAMIHHQVNEVILNHHQVSTKYQNIWFNHLDVVPMSFHFNSKGHISQALTIRFFNYDATIVAQLGSGSFALR